MRKSIKKVFTFMLAVVMVFSIQMTVSAAPDNSKSNTDVKVLNPLEELFKKLGVEDLEGVEFVSLPSKNTLIKMSDEDGTGGMLMATGGSLTLDDFKEAGKFSKDMGIIFAIVPKQYEAVINEEITGYLKNMGLGLIYVVSDNILDIENAENAENFKIYYIWSIETIKRTVPLNPVIEMNPEGYDDILEKVDGKGVIAHFENEGELPGNASIMAMYSGVNEDLFDKTEEFSLFYINGKTRELELENRDAFLGGNMAMFEISHTSDYLIADVSDTSGGKADVNKTNRNNVKKSPQTGDNSMASVYIILAGASVLTLMAGRKKRNA